MRPVTKVYLYDDEEKFFGEGPFLLLKGIENSGSLRASAQQIGVSYSKALSIIKRAETILGFPLTERSIGGTGGGGSCLTIRGKQFLNRYERYNLMCQEKNLALFRHFWDQPDRLRLGCVLMASGMGKRFGGNKLMAPFREKPLIQYILDSTKGDLFAARVVVTRHKEIETLCLEQGINVVLHHCPGRNDTVRLGVEALLKIEPALDGVMFCACDQPLVSEKSLREMTESFYVDPSMIYRLNYDKHVGNPVIFPCSDFERLKKLPENNGGAAIMREYPHRIKFVSAQSHYELMDVDTQEQLEELEKLL